MLEHTFKFPEKSLSRWWEILVFNSKFTEKIYKAHADNKKTNKQTKVNNEYICIRQRKISQLSISKRCLPSVVVLPSTEGRAQHYCLFP